ncbi:hypothetical protein [Minwuia sp.]|uniref:hypothetical protein n=1 Tax=Minwuia sp. TaxID=2493630 RepID=UPI003A8D3F53
MTDLTATEETETDPPKSSGGDGSRTGMLLFAALLLLMPIAPSTFAVVAVYMAPTWLTACFRPFHLPGAIATVAGMNFAGTLPALYYLWTRGNNFETAFMLLFHTEFQGMNLAAAAMGISLLWIAPFIARTWVDIASQRLLHKAEAEREKLIDEWGDHLFQKPDSTENG